METPFNLAVEIAKANAEHLENRPLVWGVDMTIPWFVRKSAELSFAMSYGLRIEYWVPDLSSKP